MSRFASHPAWRWALTALLTAALAGLFALGVAWGRVAVRVGEAEWRALPVADVWRAPLDHLPPQAPDLLGRGVLMGLLALAVPALAYVLAATLRLPDAKREPGADTGRNECDGI